MFCPHCSAPNPDQADFCQECGKTMHLAPPMPAPSPAPSPLPPQPAPVAPARALPYRWGKFQGWAMLVASAFLMLGGYGLLNQPSTTEELRQGAFALVLLGIFFIPTAFGILKRRRFGIYLVEAILIIFILAFFGLVNDHADQASTLVPTIIFWAYCTYYYYRRRIEFR